MLSIIVSLKIHNRSRADNFLDCPSLSMAIIHPIIHFIIHFLEGISDKLDLENNRYKIGDNKRAALLPSCDNSEWSLG